MFSICLTKLTIPFFNALVFSFVNSDLKTPPLYFNALTVATITTQLGAILAYLHFMLKNFSAPRSDPNPASVIAKSPSFKASLVALTELQP